MFYVNYLLHLEAQYKPRGPDMLTAKHSHSGAM